jgi:hypothetical protein
MWQKKCESKWNGSPAQDSIEHADGQGGGEVSQTYLSIFANIVKTHRGVVSTRHQVIPTRMRSDRIPDHKGMQHTTMLDFQLHKLHAINIICGLTATPTYTSLSCSSTMQAQLASDGSHSRTVESAEADTQSPDGRVSTSQTREVCPRKTATSSPFATSQTRTVVSDDPDTNRVGVCRSNATDLTLPVCPDNVCRSEFGIT